MIALGHIPPSLPRPRHRSSLRRLAQHAWARLLYHTGSLAYAKRSLRRRGAIVVLALHRVLDERGCGQSQSLKAIVVKHATFEALAARAVAAYDCVEATSVWPGTSAARPMLAFTFDDGWQDNLEHAMPVLAAHRIPAAIFLCTGTVDQSTPFWPERLAAAVRQTHPQVSEEAVQHVVESFKSQHPQDVLAAIGTSCAPAAHDCVDRTMSWEDVRTARTAGIRFGAHTHTHPILTRVPAERVEAELSRSRSELEVQTGEPCTAMAYPNGDFSPAVAKAVEAGGFRRAFTMERAAWLPDTSQFAIPRCNVQESDLVGLDGRFSIAVFEYTTFWKAWLKLRRAPLPRQEGQR